MSRAALVIIMGLLAIAGPGIAPAAAGDYCDCGYPVYGTCAPRTHAYYYEPRVLYRHYHPRWQHAAAYYNPPPRAYGYAYVSRGPAILVHRTWRRHW